jgi:DNA-binding transcriptional regulator YhcF (GntR family)
MYKLGSDSWKIGDRINSVAIISSMTGVPRYSVNKALNHLMRRGYLDNRGTNGTWVINKPRPVLSTVMRRIDKIETYTRYMKTAQLIANGALFDRKSSSVITRNHDVITFFFPFTGKEKVISIASIINVIKSPIEASDLKHENKTMLQKYASQEQAKEVISIALRHKKKLGIELG